MDKKVIILILISLFFIGCVTFTGTNEPGLGDLPNKVDADGEAVLFLILTYCCLFVF